jgi:thiol-disulfide isomerase/thioredoxin
MASVRWAVVAVCVGLALAGCGVQNEPGARPAGEARTAVSEQLRFTAKTVDGQDFSGESLAGKPAVLWFWTPWCPRCQGEAEHIVAAAKETEGSVRFVGVAAQDEVVAMRGFVDRFGLGSFPHIADEDLAVWQRFGVVEQPSYAFITADGTVETVTRQLYRDDLREKVRALAR